MSPIAMTVMAFSMSADAFAVAIGKGTTMKSPNLKQAVKVGLLFGVVEAITPIIGWLAGTAASGFIEAIDHWVCFVILALVGGKMIFESFQPVGEEDTEANSTKAKKSKFGKLGILILTAVGTSIDAMAVGVSLAFMDVNIWIAALSIGAATTLMVIIGQLAGHYLGSKVGKYAEGLGGVALILIGGRILALHLGYF